MATQESDPPTTGSAAGSVAGIFETILRERKPDMAVNESISNIAVDDFLVGPEKKRLRVYSLVLSNASSYFKAMFGPNFMEGQNLGPNALTEIALPEDNPEAMAIIFNVIHSQNSAVKENLDSNQIFQVAVAADKYDCVGALTHAIKDWLNFFRFVDIHSRWQLLLAAYWFDNVKSFKDLSLSLIIHHKGSYLDLATKGDVDSETLMRICTGLEEERTKVRLQLLHIMIEASAPAVYTCPCGWNAKHSVAYIELLRVHNLFPRDIFQKTIWQFLESVAKLKEPDPEHLRPVCKSLSCHQNPNFKVRLGERITELRRYDGIGLCLQCIRLGQAHGILGKRAPSP